MRCSVFSIQYSVSGRLKSVPGLGLLRAMSASSFASPSSVCGLPRFLGLLAILLFSSVSHAAQFKFATQTFTVPGGFEVELVAGPPLVERPVSASFDEQGRLYVTDSSGSNEKPDKQLEAKPHRVVRLEDAHGGGNFDKSVVFADKMMFPEGC